MCAENATEEENKSVLVWLAVELLNLCTVISVTIILHYIEWQIKNNLTMLHFFIF